MVTQSLRVGAGRCRIHLADEWFPIEGFVGVHDPLHVRALVLERAIRVVIVSIELTSIPPWVVDGVQRSVSLEAATSPANVLVSVTHTFSAPHFAPGLTPSEPASSPPVNLLFQAVLNAVLEATRQAMTSTVDARLCCGAGQCDINVNRDVLTADGWWLGANEFGPSDKTVHVLRFEDLTGIPIGLLFVYGVQPSVMDGSEIAAGGRLASADLAGSASRFVEQAYGGRVTALFGIGAAGDQAPALKAQFPWLDQTRRVQVHDIHESGFVIAELLGRRLAAEVLRVSELAHRTPTTGPLSLVHLTMRLSAQVIKDRNILHPTTHYEFEPAGDRDEPVAILRIGEVTLVGVRPELNSETAVELRRRSPVQPTVVLTMVNGGAKYMPDQGAYDRITYEAMNSPFWRGSAEILSERILNHLAG